MSGNKSVWRIGLAGLTLALLCVPVFAQRVPQNYSVINFRKVAPEKVDEFLAFQKDQVRKLNQSLLDSGDIKSWMLVKLTMPYATGSDHNYATVTGYDKFPNLDRSTAELESTFSKAGLSLSDFVKRSRELSTGVSQQITRTFLRIGHAETGDFVRVDYHQVAPDRMAELIELEESVYAPMDKARIEAGDGFKSWSLSFPVLPVSAETGWNFYTSQVFKDSASLGGGARTGEEVFKKVHPNRNYLSTMERVRAIDKIVKVRIYHVLDSLGAPVMPAELTSR